VGDRDGPFRAFTPDPSASPSAVVRGNAHAVVDYVVLDFKDCSREFEFCSKKASQLLGDGPREGF